MKVFVHDVSICNGCYNCQIACKDEHVSNDWAPYAKPQPEIGHFWLKLSENVRGQVPRVKVAYYPIMCQHCKDAPCMAACKPGAIYRRDDGLVVADPQVCTGCKNCVDACPYGVIYFNEGLNIAQKCTGCAHLLDSGWKEPRCVDACPTLALKFMEEEEAKAMYGDKAEYLKPERVALDKPNFFYMGLPKRFVAGTVYDPAEKEVVIGAKVSLTDKNAKYTYSAETDNYGDFEFEKLAVSDFDLKIENGGKSKTMQVNTAQDVSLGDIPLT